MAAVIFATFFYGCGREQITSEKVNSILKISEQPEKNPVSVNIYVDISSSMKEFLDVKSDKYLIYDNFIRDLYNNLQNANISLYGFGDTLEYLGNGRDKINEILQKSFYDRSLSKIHLVFDNILKDTSNSFNIVISDALYENEKSKEFSNMLGFMMSPYLKDQVAKDKLFGILANKFAFKNSKLNAPLYLFIFGEKYHRGFLENNLLKLAERSYIVSSNNDFNVNLSLSENTGIVFQNKKLSCLEINNYGMPSNIKLIFERFTKNQFNRNNISNEKYRILITEKKIIEDENGNFIPDSNWKRTEDVKYDFTVKFNKDSTKQIVDMNLQKSFSESRNYTVYKITIYPKQPEWIIDEYSSENPNEIDKTYKLKDFFTNLENYLEENPCGVFSYYIIIK